MKSYGGFLPIDVGNTEYYKENDAYYISRLNAARYGIVEVCKSNNSQKIWIPKYLCKSVSDALLKNDINVETYEITSKFVPVLDKGKVGDDFVLITNYFGLNDEVFYNDMIKKYTNIIFDNTQAFYAAPVIKDGVYNVYSPRKFFGVSDGAYVVAKKDLCLDRLEKDYSGHRANYLFCSFEEGTNKNYVDYMQAEEDISCANPKYMSDLTKALLSSVDYSFVKIKRRNNFEYIHKKLLKYNELNIDEKLLEKCVPMVYPFLYSGNDRFRDYLIENKIYVPQWWKWVLELNNINDFEKKLCKYLYPIPIDQRYSVNDMEAIFEIIMNVLA